MEAHPERTASKAMENIKMTILSTIVYGIKDKPLSFIGYRMIDTAGVEYTPYFVDYDRLSANKSIDEGFSFRDGMGSYEENSTLNIGFNETGAYNVVLIYMTPADVRFSTLKIKDFEIDLGPVSNDE